MHRLLFLILFLATAIAVDAQEDMEYRWEAGAAIGAVAYEGDFNGSILREMSRPFIPRIGAKFIDSIIH